MQASSIAATLGKAGLAETASMALALALLDPRPGTVDSREVAAADELRLMLLAAIVSITRLREDPDSPRQLLEHLGRQETELDFRDRGRYWHLRAYLAWRQDGRIDLAYTALNRSIHLLEDLANPPDPGYTARVWDTYGQLQYYQGLMGSARRDYEFALALREQAEDEAGEALTLGNLARLAMELGEFPQATDYLRRDLAIVERLSPELTRLRMQLHTHLGSCLLEAGDTKGAEQEFHIALSLARQDNPNGPEASFAHIGLARAQLTRSAPDYSQAIELLDQAERNTQSQTIFPGLLQELLANIAYVRGDIHWAQGDSEQANAEYRQAMAHFDTSQTSSPVEYARLLHRLARIELKNDHPIEGAQLLREALRRLDATAMDKLRQRFESKLKEASREIWLLHTAGRFLGQGQLNLLLEQTGGHGFQGSETEMTVLFSDIRRFTSISEALGPKALIEVLNDYLTRMTRCIERFGGIVDKFIGDAVMALFPCNPGETSGAARAAGAALMMQAELDHFNRTLPRHVPRFESGIGLHSGKVVAGLIGSPQKRSYTAIGDTVNTASRLEGMTKPLGAAILVSEEFRKRLPVEGFLLRPLGQFRPKGRDEPVAVYDLMMAFDDSLDCLEMAGEIAFVEKALEAFRSGNFTEAQSAWLRLADNAPGTLRARGYRFLADYADGLRDAPTPEAWTGLVILTEK
ncbi:MAG: tetratricopeptide repeat protein [Chromatiales bacterium]|nr:tetratricopeptide repeat protein [Chromatiales bacterium]